MAGCDRPRPAAPVRRGRLGPRLSAAVALLAVASLAAPSAGDDSPQQPTFRGGTNYIRVDLYASLDGRPVTDLRQDEIDILEDGVAQRVEAFEHVQVPAGGPEALRVEPNSIRAGEQAAADPRARVFVIFLDIHHMDAQVAQQLRTPIRRFMEEALGPDDLIAVMTPEMPVSALTFTRRTTVLSGMLGDTAEWLRRDATSILDPIELLYRQCYGEGPGSPAGEMARRKREQLSLDALEALTLHLAAVRDERKAVLVVTLGWEMFEESERLAESGGGLPPAPADLLGVGRDPEAARGEALRMQCEADRMALARLNHRDRMRDITGEANRGNVSFYPISPLRIDTPLARLGHLRSMAEDTDGLAVVNTNNISEPMRRIIADTSSYYLLGYTSTNSTLDGRFRRIAVRVRRSGVEVRARPGYRALSIAEVRTTRAPTTGPRVEAAVTAALRRVASATVATPLRIRIASWTRAAPGGGTALGTVWIVGELDAQTRKELAWNLGGRGEATLLSSDGTPVTAAAFALTNGQAAFAVRAPEAGALAPGEYSLRVRLRANGDDSRSLSDLLPVTLALSPSTFGEPLLLRRGPTTGLQYVQTADPRFRRNERLRLELPSDSSDPASARFLDRVGKPLQVPASVTTREGTSDAWGWIVVDASLAPLAPGDYVLEVTQAGASQVVAFRLVP